MKQQNQKQNQQKKQENFQNIRDIDRQQKQQVKHLYNQLKKQKEKKKRLEKQYDQKLKAIQNKVIVQKTSGLYQQIQEDFSTQVPVDGEIFAGSRVYMINCASCHALQPTTKKTNTAPSFGLLFNRKSGTDQNFPTYSTPLISSSFFWNSLNLYKFMTDPRSLVEYTNCKLMTHPLKQQTQRADLIAFMKQYSKQLALNMKIQAVKADGYDLYQTKLYSANKLQERKQKYVDMAKFQAQNKK